MSAEERKAQAPLIWQRIREHGAIVAADERLASVIGRLSLDGTLSDGEAATAVYIGETIGRYERLSDAPKRDAASPAFMRGFKVAMDPYARGDADSITRFERKVKKAKKAYDKLLGYIPSDHAEAVLYDICVCDKEINSALYPDLKKLLSVIGAKLGLMRQVEQAEAKAPKANPADAVHMAQAMVDAISDHIARSRATFLRFELDHAAPAGERGLVIFAMTEDGREARKVIRMRLRGLIPAVLDAQIIKAAEAKWRVA